MRKLSKVCVSSQKLARALQVWNDKVYAGPSAIRAQVNQTLADLQTGYLDLCLIHWPVPLKHIEA